MKALLCPRYGAPDVLELGDLPTPQPGPGQVRIRVSHAGVSFVDQLMVADRHQNQHPLPFAPGMEVAGTIDALGDSVAESTDLEVGAPVAALVYDGGYAEYAVADAHECFALPDGLDPAVAAGMLSVYLTAHLALSDAASLRADERLVISGAAGGVGLAAVDLGRRAGADVVGIASTDEKRRRVEAYGARALAPEPETLRARIGGSWSGDAADPNRPPGADVVLDPVAGPLWQPLFRSLAWGGRYLIVGFAGGEIPKFPANHLLVKQRAAIGFVLMTYRKYRHALLRAAARDLFAWTVAGELRPHVEAPLPLDRGADALQRIVERRAIGKMVLRIDG